jgi:hypothetical protein
VARLAPLQDLQHQVLASFRRVAPFHQAMRAVLLTSRSPRNFRRCTGFSAHLAPSPA